MYIQSAEGLLLQGSGSGNTNYGFRNVSKSVSHTYAQGWVNILTITASGSAPTNFTVSFYYTWNVDNQTAGGNTGGPQTNYYSFTGILNSSGIFVSQAGNGMYGQGNAWASQNTDVATARTIKLQSQGTSATYTSLITTYHILVSCSDFSLVTFS